MKALSTTRLAAIVALGAILLDLGVARVGRQLNGRTDLPQWIDADSTALVLAAAGAAAVYAASALGVEGRRDERFRDGQRRQQLATRSVRGSPGDLRGVVSID